MFFLKTILFFREDDKKIKWKTLQQLFAFIRTNEKLDLLNK